MTLTALVVGVGKVGSRFDGEPGRRAVWSHVGAYLARPASFRLAGACDPDHANANAFRRRCPSVPVFAELSASLAEIRPTIVSICTPADQHATMIEQTLKCGSVRAIWCEKPLATKTTDGAMMVNACALEGVHLVVSYVRRWMPIWRRARELVETRAVGSMRVIRISVPNRIWSMGSHAIDLMQFLAGEIIEVTPFALPELEQEGEATFAAMFRLQGAAYGIFQVTGWKANYIIEAEVVGDDGRIVVREDLGTIAIERFEPSTRYDGYRELGTSTVERVTTEPEFSPFVAIADEIVDLLAGVRAVPTCDGSAALAVQQILERIALSGGQYGRG